MYDSSSSDAAAGIFASLFGLGITSFSFLWMCFYCLMILVSIGAMVLWIVMIVDVARREEKDFPDKGDNQKTIWLLIIILGGGIGAAVYYFLVYKKANSMITGSQRTAVKKPTKSGK